MRGNAGHSLERFTDRQRRQVADVRGRQTVGDFNGIALDVNRALDDLPGPDDLDFFNRFITGRITGRLLGIKAPRQDRCDEAEKYGLDRLGERKTSQGWAGTHFGIPHLRNVILVRLSEALRE